MNEMATDETVLQDLGERLAAARIRAGPTQAELARAAGVSRGMVERLERGGSSQLANLVRCLRALGLLANLAALAPAAGPTPIDLLEGHGARRRRVRRAASPPKARPFAWGDKA